MTKKKTYDDKELPPELREWAERWQLDDYELELEKAFERGEFTLAPNQEQLKAEAKAAAQNYFKKNARLNMRISNHDLLALKRKAAIDGIPYQTLAASIIHKYLNGTLS